MNMSQAVILAGGLGTRLKPFTDSAPKPMIPVEGVPFLQHLLLQVRAFGIRRVVLLLGYLPEKIINYFGDGRELEMEITYSVTPVSYDTGARIREARDLLEDVFLLLYCDNYCPIDFQRAMVLFQEKGSLLQVTAYANQDGYTKSNLLVEDGIVKVYDKNRQQDGLQGVDIGYALVRKEILERLPEGNVNFEAALYPKLVEENKMSAYVTDHRYYSIGSWERMELTKQFFQPKKVVFLDRDGTLNVRPQKACYVDSPDSFVWLPKAREAVKFLKEKGFQIYLVTNQPGIARGMLTWEQLEAVHEKLRLDLREIGTDIDGIYICPHGWDEGCDCRKPKPGMLYRAQREHSLDLTKCILIGDDERDIEAGQAAGLARNILVGKDRSLWDAVQNL